jgi:hypothetical protein
MKEQHINLDTVSMGRMACRIVSIRKNCHIDKGELVLVEPCEREGLVKVRPFTERGDFPADTFLVCSASEVIDCE